MKDAIEQVRARKWFYPYRLPDGSTVSSYHSNNVQNIHETRWSMLKDCMDRLLAETGSRGRAIDIGCHQGYFTIGMRQAGFEEVVGIDARESHIDDSRLMAEALGLDRLTLECAHIDNIEPELLGSFDLVLMFGLLYHLENPIGALRCCRRLCRGICVIETQLAPNTSGFIDFGSPEFVRQLRGSFNIVDETDEQDGLETGVSGISLVPSYEALVWSLMKVGFSNVTPLAPPKDGWDQLVHHKRVMVVAS